MATNTSTPARNEFFKQLKPCCVSISTLAIRPPEEPAKIKKLTELTEELFNILSDQVNRDPSVMDEKLADYVFFPLSHVFRSQEQYPVQLVELAIKCVTVLLVHGWKSKVSPQLVQQLLILLTFIAGGVPGGEDKKRVIPEEAELETLRALTALIDAAGLSTAAAAALVEAQSIPTLGHTITVVLETIAHGRTPQIQLEALRTLQAVYTSIKDDEALATFLPGIVSWLTRVLSKPAGEKKKVLVASIQSLKLVLIKVLGDVRTRSILAKADSNKTGESDKGKVLTPAWLQATVPQIKMALATVLKLRTHESVDVRDALERLSVALLDECHSSLESSAPILVETAIMLASTDRSLSITDTSLQDLASIYPELGETVKATVYNWVMSLPRIMGSSDEGKKQAAIRNLNNGLATVTALQLDSSTLDDSIASALRDSAISLVAATKSGNIFNEVQADEGSWFSKDLVKTEDSVRQYSPVLINQESQTATRLEMLRLISKVGSVSQQTKLAAEMLEYSRESGDTSQITSLWLAFELIKAAFARSSDVDNFLDFSSLTPTFEDPEAIFHELYSFAVTILNSHAELSDVDWRLEAVALEATAFAATRSGEAFKPELIDVLYPITTFLGSQIPQLREHAITTLNILAASCGYTSVSELIIENVDYMVNSVSLRLNTFDISPASTKVLIMMTRLTGPRLIPYLDDVVASIFAALDNYHGYPVLVENLFGVLKEVVEQGVRSDRLLLEGRQNAPNSHRKVAPKAITIDDILQVLNKRAEIQAKVDQDPETELKGHPKTPWKSKKGKGRVDDLNAEADADVDADADEEPSNTEIEKEKPPKTPTYILLEKVANLTQHYLTSPTPTLRKSLLDLLATVTPALAGDEDSFLPLINAVWPVIISRLYDSESFVTIAACDAICVLCSAAGDFLSSRIKTEWSTGLGKWCRKKKEEARQSRGKIRPSRSTGTSTGGVDVSTKGIIIPFRTGLSLEGKESSEVVTTSSASTGGLGRFAQPVQIWDAVIRLLIAIVTYVRVRDEVFDEILELLVDILGQNREAREALEVINADAVWLALYQQGLAEWKPTPQMAGVTFVPMERHG